MRCGMDPHDSSLILIHEQAESAADAHVAFTRQCERLRRRSSCAAVRRRASDRPSQPLAATTARAVVRENQGSARGISLSSGLSRRDDAGGGQGYLSAAGLDSGISEVLSVGVEAATGGNVKLERFWGFGTRLSPPPACPPEGSSIPSRKWATACRTVPQPDRPRLQRWCPNRRRC